MSIRNLLSNAALSLASAPEVLNNSAAVSTSIDLSLGSTGAIMIAMDSAAAASGALLLEYSDDNSTWVTDNGSTGNTFVDSDGAAVASPVTTFPALVIAEVVNPQGRYYRATVTEGGTQAMPTCMVGWVGPVHYVDPEA